MTIRSVVPVFGLALTLACGGGGGSSSGGGYTPPAGPPANTVWVGGAGSYGGGGGTTAFNPPILTVTAGTTVTFLWKGGTHNVTSYAVSGSPTFTSSGDHSNAGDSDPVLFSTAGTYYYRCTYHSTAPADANSVATGAMVGKVVVN